MMEGGREGGVVEGGGEGGRGRQTDRPVQDRGRDKETDKQRQGDTAKDKEKMR